MPKKDCNIQLNASRFIGGGEWSDIFDLGDRVLKVSYYSQRILANMNVLLKSGTENSRKKAKALRDSEKVQINTKMFKVGNYFITHGISPHFVKEFSNYSCKNFYAKIRNFIPETQRVKRNQRGDVHFAHLSVQDKYDTDLFTYIRDPRYPEFVDVELRVVIFQILYTLAVLQRAMHGFRHNDLHTKNILVKRDTIPPRVYAYGGSSYTIGAMPFQVAITDFDFTNVSGAIQSNIGVAAIRNPELAQYNITSSANPSYDSYMFLVSMFLTLDKHRLEKNMETWKFLDNTLHGRLSERMRGNTDDVSLFPSNLLKHPYFDVLRRPSSSSPSSLSSPGQASNHRSTLVTNNSNKPLRFTVNNKTRKLLERCSTASRQELDAIATKLYINPKTFKNKEALCKEIRRVLSRASP